MTMKLQFDANQQFQLDGAAVAVADLFDGQPLAARPSSRSLTSAPLGPMLGYTRASSKAIWASAIRRSWTTRSSARTPERCRIAMTSTRLTRQCLSDGWELFDGPLNRTRRRPHFSVEMETGIRGRRMCTVTIFELYRRYGFAKFVIVVPSVAIREGVLKNLQITAEHLKAIYNQEAEHFVYDAKRVNRLRQFATSTMPQVLVINIDAFRKNFTGTEAEQKSNVIYKESDKLSGGNR